jgi:hypothetical protein
LVRSGDVDFKSENSVELRISPPACCDILSAQFRRNRRSWSGVEVVMKKLCLVLAALTWGMPSASAAECRRVVEPTVIAVVAHGDVFVRKAERGMTFRAEGCKTKIGSGLYCRMAKFRQPEVYLRHTDSAGKEYTAFWGNDCK